MGHTEGVKSVKGNPAQERIAYRERANLITHSHYMNVADMHHKVMLTFLAAFAIISVDEWQEHLECPCQAHPLYNKCIWVFVTVIIGDADDSASHPRSGR